MIGIVIDVKDLLDERMAFNELPDSEEHGCTLFIPNQAFGTPLSGDELRRLQTARRISLGGDLEALYRNLECVKLHWELYDKEGDPMVTTAQFIESPWLKERYLDNGYSWEFVKELLSGSMYVSSAEELLTQNRARSYYVVLDAMGLDPREYRLFDAGQRATALLKIEDDALADHIWILDLDARKLYDMAVGVEEYFSLAYNAKIFNAWQLVYVLKKEGEFYELMKRYLPAVVPHLRLDLSAFGM